ncbi:RNA polymerase sigma factor [Gudongella oleilytica]|uniref:RNA polymerase sigma factor n=1 Tax=Gudongella oleilytica TaxID=1582259 RepID=UPI000FF88114|nr:sigma-70 family RNA polymerase sigma factor [Gudongella oleilytica]
MKEYKIRVKNEIVTVSKEIYTAYYKLKRRERYIEETSIKNNLSYDQLVELDYPIEQKMCDQQLLVEDVIIEKIMLEKLMLALEELTDCERLIINELFFNGKSERELADSMKLPRTTLQSRKNSIISKLKKIIEK